MRALKKERKHYHYDWSIIADPAARFENLVASHLLKWVEYQIDCEGRAVELRYFRDIDGREVDFVITHGKTVMALVECKLDDAQVSPGLKYLKRGFPTPRPGKSRRKARATSKARRAFVWHRRCGC